MGFRTVILSNESKMSLRMNHLVVQSDKLNHIPLGEIDVVIIENPNITLTGHIINALASNKILTIVCDKNHLPCTAIESIYGHHRQSKNIKKQVRWNTVHAERMWQLIIREKILHQGLLVKKHHSDFNLDDFNMYAINVELNDLTNREGHAAKVYFRALFGEWFTRSFDDPLNAGLNYGYALIHSAFSRVIKSKGYLTELGINHTSEYNQHNLSSDFMEPFRPMIDDLVFRNIDETFEKYEKRILIDVFNSKVRIQNKNQYLLNAIDIYVESIIKFLETGEENFIKFPDWKYRYGD